MVGSPPDSHEAIDSSVALETPEGRSMNGLSSLKALSARFDSCLFALEDGGRAVDPVLLQTPVEIEYQSRGIALQVHRDRGCLAGSHRCPISDFGDEQVSGHQDGGQHDEKRCGFLRIEHRSGKRGE